MQRGRQDYPIDRGEEWGRGEQFEERSVYGSPHDQGIPSTEQGYGRQRPRGYRSRQEGQREFQGGRDYRRAQQYSGGPYSQQAYEQRGWPDERDYSGPEQGGWREDFSGQGTYGRYGYTRGQSGQGQGHGREYEQRGYAQGPYGSQSGYGPERSEREYGRFTGPEPAYGYGGQGQPGYQPGYQQGYSQQAFDEYQQQGHPGYQQARGYGQRGAMREDERRGLEEYYGGEEHFSYPGQPGFRQGVEQSGYAQQPFQQYGGEWQARRPYEDEGYRQGYGRPPMSRGGFREQPPQQQWEQRRQPRQPQGRVEQWQQQSGGPGQQTRGRQDEERQYRQWLQEHEREPRRTEAERQLEGLQDDNEGQSQTKGQPRSQRLITGENRPAQGQSETQNRSTRVRAAASTRKEAQSGSGSRKTKARTAKGETKRRREENSETSST